MTLTKACIVIVMRETIYRLNKISLKNIYFSLFYKDKNKYCADTY